MLLGFHAKKRVGKDTAAKVLVDNFNFKRYAFADPLKQHIYILNPIVVAEDYPKGCLSTIQQIVDYGGWDWAKQEYPEVRRLLQVYGTEVMRNNFGEDVWVNLTFNKIKLENPENVAISDLRFPNELKAIKNYGGKLVKIKSNRVSDADNHASEQDLPDELFDYVITNNGTLEEFQNKIKILWTYGISQKEFETSK